MLITYYCRGWNDEFYKQLVELITFSRELEAFGGSEGLLSLVAEPQVNDAALFVVKESALNWAQATGFNIQGRCLVRRLVQEDHPR